MKPWLKRRKNLEFYETLLAELRLEDKFMFMGIMLSLLNYEQFNIYFFPRFHLLHFFFSNHLSDFVTFHKNLL